MLAMVSPASEDERVSCVLFVVHPDRLQAKELAATARQWWEAHGIEVIEASTTMIGDTELSPSCDFAISFGGDGTMLRTVQLVADGGTPVLGINLGRMGYLTEVEPAGMVAAFSRLVAGEYSVEERMRLEVAVERADDSRPEPPRRALNEAIIERDAPGHTIRVEVAVNRRRFLTYVADGLLSAPRRARRPTTSPHAAPSSRRRCMRSCSLLWLRI